MFSLANHEKSKKHKENLEALKLILQEEEEIVENATHLANDSDSSDSELSEDLLLDNSDRQYGTVGGIHYSGSDTNSDKRDDGTHSDTGDVVEHGSDWDRHNDKSGSRHEPNNITKISNDSSKLAENDSIPLANNGDEESKSCENVDNDDGLLQLAQNKKRQKENQPLDNLGDEFGLISVAAEKSEEPSSLQQRYKNLCTEW